MRRSMGPALVVLLLGAGGCHHEIPAPAYPVPTDLPLEETDLWQYVEPPDEPSEEEWQEEDEGWNDVPAGEEQAPAEGEGEGDVEPGPPAPPAP
jgi:hypothetical protein